MKHSLFFPASALIAAALTAAGANAQISFTNSSTLATGQRPDTVAFGDFDLDLDADLAVTTDNQDKIEIWSNDGTGGYTFSFSILTGANTGAGALVAEDFTGDGLPDLAVSLHNSSAVAIYANTGGGIFVLTGTTAVGADPRSMDAGDVDGDGDLDLVTSNRGSSSVSVLTNNGSGVMNLAGTTAVGDDLRGIVLSDFNNDGSADVAVSSHDSREVYVMISAGGGGLGAPSALSVGAQLRPEGITAGDVTGNGFADLAVSTSGNGLNFVTVFQNAGGSFGAGMNWSVSSVDPDSIVAADLDADGDLDLAVAGQSSNDVSFLANSGAGVFAASGSVSTGVRPGGMACADIDGDGDADLGVANRDGNSVSVLMNNADPAGAVSYCVSAPNSAGAGAMIGNTGSLSIATNDFTLTVTGSPASQFGLFYYGPNQIQVPFGDGFRCVGGGTFRLNPPSLSDFNGENSKWVDFTSGPAGSGSGMIAAGSSWNFQYWYRDPAAMGADFNLSDGLAATFLP